jgi:hypothetical protein
MCKGGGLQDQKPWLEKETFFFRRAEATTSTRDPLYENTATSSGFGAVEMTAHTFR